MMSNQSRHLMLQRPIKLLAVICFLLISAFGFAQVNNENVTIAFNNETIKEAIFKIESNLNVEFYFLENWLPDQRVTKSYTAEPLAAILTDLFKDTVINFYIYSDNRIILTENRAIYDKIPESGTQIPTDDEEIVTARPIFNDEKETKNEEEETVKIGKEETTQTQQVFTISGYVKEVSTKKPLANVAISVKDGTAGTTTDADGFYQLRLKPGNYTLITNALNAKTQTKKIGVFNDGVVDFNLVENIESLKEVVVEAEADRNVKEVITGVTKIEVESIKNIPLVLGERDILKVATTLPGIANTGEGSNGYNVRGGKTDQNLILLDNAAVYNPTHFFGIFSALNPFTTGDVNIYKGNIPAEYGGRLSSVFDISTKDANTEKFAAEASIGPVTSNVTVEFPLVEEKAGLLIGARSTYSNWILRSLDEESLRNSQASFFDAIIKYNHEINGNNKINATAYYSNDDFSITSDSLYGYSNRVLSFGWRHKLNDRHRAELALTNSEYQFDIEYDGDFSNDFELDYKNNETELKLKLDYELDDTKNLTYGVASKLYNISPGSFQPLNSDSNIEPLVIDKEKALESSVFGSINYDITEKFAIDAGLRFSYYMFLGPGEQRIYEQGQTTKRRHLAKYRDIWKQRDHRKLQRS